MKVYCEHGAITSGLHRLQLDGRIEIIQFPYERRTRRAAEAHPSGAELPGPGGATRKEADASGDDFAQSEKYSEIERIIGGANQKDIWQVDAAYKSGCNCFFTTDKRDILSKRSELEELLGIMFFHPQEDWQTFLAILRKHELKRGRG